MINLSIKLQLEQPGDESSNTLGRYSLGRCEKLPHPPIADFGWGRSWLIEPERDQSCPPGQGRSLGAPEDDNVSSPNQKYSYTSTPPKPRGRKRLSSGSIPHSTVWKAHAHPQLVDRLRLIEPERDQSCPSGQRRGPEAPEEDEVPSLDENYIHTPRCRTTPGRKA